MAAPTADRFRGAADDLETDFEAGLKVKARRDRLDEVIAAVTADSEVTPLVRRRGCPRGVSDRIALALGVEIGDWHRFADNTMGSFVGLVAPGKGRLASWTTGRLIVVGRTRS